MKEVKCYQCEICKEIYVKEYEAIECENIGKEKQLVKVGDILLYKYNVSGFDCETEIKISKVIDKGHSVIYKFKSKSNGKWDDDGVYGVNKMYGNSEFLRRTT